MHSQTLAQWKVKQCSLSETLTESYRAHRLLADRVLHDGNFSGYSSLLPSAFTCRCLLLDEGIHVWWDEGQIMKVIYLMKQPKKSRFYSLVSFTKPQEKPWKRKYSSHCFVSQHFLTWGWDQNFVIFLLWQYKLDKNFNLTFEKNRSLLSPMSQWLPKYASKCWWNHNFTSSSQQRFQSEIDKHWNWFYFTTIFLNYNWITRLKTGFELHRNVSKISEIRSFLWFICSSAVLLV